MREHLFFDIKGPIDEVANKVFTSLGMGNSIQEGDSTHVLEGIYYESSAFGVQVKLERNSYDYDDRYNCMMTIYKDVLSDLQVDDSIVRSVTDITIKLLVSNLKILVAYEIGEDNLRVYS
jgi:hypothetical protein